VERHCGVGPAAASRRRAASASSEWCEPSRAHAWASSGGGIRTSTARDTIVGSTRVRLAASSSTVVWAGGSSSVLSSAEAASVLSGGLWHDVKM
jgi:hypothetical protein